MKAVDALAGLEAIEIIDRDAFGWVEMVSSKAMYVRTSSDDILILSPTPLTPYTIVVDSEWKHVQAIAEKNRFVRKTSEEIVIGGEISLRIRGCNDEKPLTSKFLPKVDNLLLAKKITQILASTTLEDPIISIGVRILRENGPNLELLKNILGQGVGATPAGDDFMAGVLLGLYILGMRPDIKSLKDHLRIRTGWLSKSIIEHSAHGCTYAPLARLCQILASDGDVVEWVVKTIQIGASTGLATLTGLLEILDHFQNILLRTSLRSSSSSGGGLQSTSTT